MIFKSPFQPKPFCDSVILGVDLDSPVWLRPLFSGAGRLSFYAVCITMHDGHHAEQFNQTSNLAWREECFLQCVYSFFYSFSSVFLH